MWIKKRVDPDQLASFEGSTLFLSEGMEFLNSYVCIEHLLGRENYNMKKREFQIGYTEQQTNYTHIICIVFYFHIYRCKPAGNLQNILIILRSCTFPAILTSKLNSHKKVKQFI